MLLSVKVFPRQEIEIMLLLIHLRKQGEIVMKNLMSFAQFYFSFYFTYFYGKAFLGCMHRHLNYSETRI